MTQKIWDSPANSVELNSILFKYSIEPSGYARGYYFDKCCLLMVANMNHHYRSRQSQPHMLGPLAVFSYR